MGAIRAASEGVDRGQRAGRGDLEDRAVASKAAVEGDSVEVAVAAKYQRRLIGIGAVGAAGEAIEDGLVAARVYLIDGALAVSAAGIGYAVEVAVQAEDQAAARITAIVTAGEAVQVGELLGRGDPVDDAVPIGTAE